MVHNYFFRSVFLLGFPVSPWISFEVWPRTPSAKKLSKRILPLRLLLRKHLLSHQPSLHIRFTASVINRKKKYNHVGCRSWLWCKEQRHCCCGKRWSGCYSKWQLTASQPVSFFKHRSVIFTALRSWVDPRLQETLKSYMQTFFIRRCMHFGH